MGGEELSRQDEEAEEEGEEVRQVRKPVFAADFETSTEVDYVEDGEVRVYLWSIRDVFDLEWEVHGGDLSSFHERVSTFGAATVWFHNLKYDMSYYVSWLLCHGWRHVPHNPCDDGEFSCLITDKGQWMRVSVQYGDHVVDFCDSLKKFPGFSLETISRIYGIPGKSDLDVKKRRPPGYQYTQEDLERVQGDTRILAVAMADLYVRDMRSITMASDAMNFFRRMYADRHGRQSKKRWTKDFPDVSAFDELWRFGYRGGWTYLNPAYEGRVIHDVKVFDVNSMYPWAMLQPMPVGMPVVRSEPSPSELYIMVADCFFTLKPGRLPTWQRKGSFRSIQADFVIQSDGFETVCMTSIDREIFESHYDVIYSGKIRYWCFETSKDLFHDYIAHWSAVKRQASIEHDDATKQTAKRYLNSLYGKWGQAVKRWSKEPVLGDDGELRFEDAVSSDGQSYLPIAMFITAYARRRIIRNADSFGADFVYADTDSIHCVGSKRPPDLDQHELGFFKLESCSHTGLYIGPKKYLHQYEYEVGSAVPKLQEVKCAGLPDEAKRQVTMENFHRGTEYVGKLAGRQVKGGYLLIETTFKIQV